jgi:hypothetical protein
VIIQGVPNYFTIPVLILGVIVGGIMLVWIFRQLVGDDHRPPRP